MFNRRTIRFLKELAENNNREWFTANKDRYESDVREPALAFIEAIQPALHKISPYFEASSKKVGGSLMRVHRDTRFGKDKTPYKTNIGIHFRHARGRDVHAPGFYVHIEPKEVFFGAGIWKPDSATLTGVRTLIVEHPDEWRAMKKKVLKGQACNLAGDSLKRAPKGVDPDHPLIEDLRRKDYMAVGNLPVKSIYEKTFPKDIARLFKQCSPLVAYICSANDLLF